MQCSAVELSIIEWFLVPFTVMGAGQEFKKGSANT